MEYVMPEASREENSKDPDKQKQAAERGSSIPKRNTLLSNSIIPRHKFLTYPATPLFLLA
jgi:hypothetical protein